MKRIGLTGGMGSGKTTVAKLFASLGAIVVDADEVARHVRKPGSPGHQAILARFQTDERMELRKILASSPEAKRDMEGILHPLIQTESLAQMDAAVSANPEAPALFYEATLLIEAGRAQDFDAVMVVTASLPDRLSRVSARDKISLKDAQTLIDTQSSDAYRLKHADFVVENLGTLGDLEFQVRKLLDQIISA